MQTNLLKPKAIQVEQLGHNKSKVTLEPFERGYGHTLGNALRRVLLSSMVGYAVTDVTIAGVLHEYSSIDGVQEDVVNILLNLKGVVFKLHNRDEVTLSLRKDGEGQVTAADIQTPHDVEIINPGHVIANLSHGGKIDIQLKVEKGRGYVPGSMRRHACVATRTCLVTGAQLCKQLDHVVAVTQTIECQTLVGESGFFAKCDHGLNHAAQLFGFGHRGFDDLVGNQRVHHVAQHGEAVLAGAVEFAKSVSVTHDFSFVTLFCRPPYQVRPGEAV